MAISTPGVGSGLDVNSIVSQMVALEKRPLTLIQQQKTSLQTKLSQYGTLKSQLASLEDATTKLKDSTNWSSRTVSYTTAGIATATASSTVGTGSYSLNVTELAQGQTTASATFTSGATVGASGSMTIRLGAWDNVPAFTADSPARTLQVKIDAGDDLTAIAGKINVLNSEDVKATVVTSGGQQRLVLSSLKTGANQGFEVAVTDGANPVASATSGLGALVVDATNLAGRRTQNAQDAEFQFQGVALTSSENTVSDLVPGLTLSLTAKGSTTLNVASDTQGIKDTIQAFVDAYNTLVKNLGTATKYDSTTKIAGPLQGDSSATGILNALRRVVGQSGPAGSSFQRLTDIGIEQQRDGTLSVNSTKLDAALQKPDDLKTFFSDVSTNGGTDGLAVQIKAFAFNANATGGTVASRNNSLQKAIDRKDDEVTKINARIDRVQAQLYAQYSRLDGTLAGLNSLGSYVSSQVSQWNKA